MVELKCSISDETGLCTIGKQIATHEGYPNLTAEDAIYRYIIDRYGWTPDVVRALSLDDLRLLLDGYREMKIVP